MRGSVRALLVCGAPGAAGVGAAATGKQLATFAGTSAPPLPAFRAFNVPPGARPARGTNAVSTVTDKTAWAGPRRSRPACLVAARSPAPSWRPAAATGLVRYPGATRRAAGGCCPRLAANRQGGTW
jgi:hypothetical protein